MSLSAVLRRAALIAVTAGLVGAPAAGAQLVLAPFGSSYELHAGGSLDPASSGLLDFGAQQVLPGEPLVAAGPAITPSTFAFGVGTRAILPVPDGATLTVPAGVVGAPDWSASVHVRVADATPKTRLMDFGTGATGDLVIEGERLGWDDGTTVTALGDPVDDAIADATWHSVTVVFEDGDAYFHLDGEESGEVLAADADQDANALTLLGAGAADLARVRTYGVALTVAEANGLEPLDGSAPVAGPDPQIVGGYFDGTDTWIGPQSVGQSFTDESTAPLAVTATVAAPGGGATVWTGPTTTQGLPLDVDVVGTMASLPPAAAALLTDGAEYDVTLEGEDVHGQATTAPPVTVRWDGTAPPLTLGAFGDRVARMPEFRGEAGTAARDDQVVSGSICSSDPCVFGPGTNEVAFFEPAIDPSGGWVADEVYEGCTCTVIDDLPRGSYHLEVWQADATGNRTLIERDFRIVDPGELVDPPKDTGTTQTTPAATSPPAPGSAAPPAGPIGTDRTRVDARQLAARLLRAAQAAFRSETVSKLVLDGARFRFTSPAAGRARIDVYTSAKARKPIASGSAAFVRPGTQTVKVRLSRAARERLRGRPGARLTLKATFVPAGAKGASVSGGRTLKR